MRVRSAIDLSTLESTVKKDFPNYSLRRKKYKYGGSSDVRRVVDKNNNTVAVLKIPLIHLYPSLPCPFHLRQSIEAIINHFKGDIKTSKALEKTGRVAKIYGVYPVEVKINEELLSDIEIIRDVAGTLAEGKRIKNNSSRVGIIDNLINRLNELKILLTKPFKVSVVLKEFVKGFSIREAKEKKIITKDEFSKDFIDLLKTLKSHKIGLIDWHSNNFVIERNNNKLKFFEMGAATDLSALKRITIEQIKERFVTLYRNWWQEEPDDKTKEQIVEIYT